nr:sulfotransferase [uncultured Cohaesibacter sp.]
MRKAQPSRQETGAKLNNAQLNRQLKLAQKQAAKGNKEEAIRLYSEIADMFPGNRRALDGLVKLGRPRSPDALQANGGELPEDLARELTERLEGKQFDAVLDMATRLLASFPNSVMLLNVAGTAHSQLDQHEQAIGHFRRALDINPKVAKTHYYLAAALVAVGEFDAARACFAQTLALEPNHVGALCQLAALKRFAVGDLQIATMISLCETGSLPEGQRSRLCFALYKALGDIDDLEQSVRYLHEGNRIRKKLLGYDASEDQRLFANIYKYHQLLGESGLVVEREPGGIVPIFILGMPRSGTTLVEQILSSHSQVEAAGEVELMSQVGTALVREQSLLTDKTVRDLRVMYQSVLAKRSGGGAFVTDKLPQNFRYINLICTIFPEAKIIHVERDARATCWSNYSHNFVTNDLGYCYDLDDIRTYYGLYARLMDFWQEQFADRIYRLSYEALVEAPEKEVRRLADAVGLNWEAGLLKPEENKRIARTASQYQVRKSIYKGSGQQWRRYQPYLDGAFDRLGE